MDFNILFKDVRNSYRFLYQYQSRVMDLVSFIGGHWGFMFEKGEAVFCNPPSWKKINPTHNWAWDFLLFYNYNFVFQPKNFKNYKDVKLMLNIVSDTGYYDSIGSADPLKIEEFEAVENSKTQLHILLKTANVDWSEYRDNQYLKSSNDDCWFSNKNGELIIGRKFDLDQFMNEASTLRSLLIFEADCEKHEIDLKPKKKFS